MVVGQQLPEQYTVPQLANFFHSLPHLNVSFHLVNNTFNPGSDIYLEVTLLFHSLFSRYFLFFTLYFVFYTLDFVFCRVTYRFLHFLFSWITEWKLWKSFFMFSCGLILKIKLISRWHLNKISCCWDLGEIFL